MIARFELVVFFRLLGDRTVYRGTLVPFFIVISIFVTSISVLLQAGPRYRRLSRDYEFLPETEECMIYLAMSQLMLARLCRATKLP